MTREGQRLHHWRVNIPNQISVQCLASGPEQHLRFGGVCNALSKEVTDEKSNVAGSRLDGVAGGGRFGAADRFGGGVLLVLRLRDREVLVRLFQELPLAATADRLLHLPVTRLSS